MSMRQLTIRIEGCIEFAPSRYASRLFILLFCYSVILLFILLLTRFEQSLTKSHDRSDRSPDSPSLTPGTTAWTVTPPSLPPLEYT